MSTVQFCSRRFIDQLIGSLLAFHFPIKQQLPHIAPSSAPLCSTYIYRHSFNEYICSFESVRVSGIIILCPDTRRTITILSINQTIYLKSSVHEYKWGLWIWNIRNQSTLPSDTKWRLPLPENWTWWGTVSHFVPDHHIQSQFKKRKKYHWSWLKSTTCNKRVQFLGGSQ